MVLLICHVNYSAELHVVIVRDLAGLRLDISEHPNLYALLYITVLI